MKYLLPLLLLLTLPACEDDDDPVTETDLTLEFQANFGDQPLAIQSENYAYPTGAELKVLLFQYYVSDLALVAADGSTVLLSEIDLIRWNSAGDSATQVRTFRVPEGDYTGIRFGVGVKPELNAQDPSNFPADYVLNEAEFWGPQTRYVFAKIEANADLEDDGTYDTGLSYHMGSDSLYREVTFNRSFTVRAGETPRLTLITDVLQAMTLDNGQAFDISDPTKQAVHGGNQEVAQSIWDNLVTGLVLQVEQ